MNLRPSLFFIAILASQFMLLPGWAVDDARSIRVSLKGEWILAEQGNDETHQSVQVKIWGSVREKGFFEHGFVQLDADEEEEYYVISRHSGTGPYNKLQIIDFRPDGILTWSYDSYGKPKIDGRIITLGLAEKYQADVEYTQYKYSVAGLVMTEEVRQ